METIATTTLFTFAPAVAVIAILTVTFTTTANKVPKKCRHTSQQKGWQINPFIWLTSDFIFQLHQTTWNLIFFTLLAISGQTCTTKT